MSLIESKHAFAARCEELDASKELQRKLKAEGIETHRSFSSSRLVHRLGAMYSIVPDS